MTRSKLSTPPSPPEPPNQKPSCPHAKLDSDRKPEDLGPSRGLLVGVVLGTALWIAAIYAIVRMLL